MAESLFIIELEFLHIRSSCSLIIVFFVLMLVGTCCFILSASLYVVRPYGLPKTHKEDTSLRPILSMIGPSQHELAKW